MNNLTLGEKVEQMGKTMHSLLANNATTCRTQSAEPNVAALPQTKESRDLQRFQQVNLQNFYKAMYEIGCNQVTVGVAMLTKEWASELIKKNTNNRKPRPQFVLEFKKKILEGAYNLNFETIVVSDEDVLLDGQNRLLGFLAACNEIEDLQIPICLVTGVPQSYFSTFDCMSKPRSGQDLLYMAKMPNYTALSPLSSALVLYERHGPQWVVSQNRLEVSHEDRMDAIEKNSPAIHVAASKLHNKTSGAIAKTYVTGLLYFLTMQKHPEEAALFWQQTWDGIDVSPDSPVVALHRCYRHATQHRRKVSNVELWVWVVKCWNAFLTNKPIKTLVWRQGSGEEIPDVM